VLQASGRNPANTVDPLMTLRVSILLAIVGTAFGIGLVYFASAILDLLLAEVAESLAFLAWLSMNVMGFLIIIGSILIFYATYLGEKRGRR
jgi:hypothetical protein